ncbi:DUF4163 domain-containing protein [Novosphingobium aquiterrae]|uniref:DUF4163 domain-containing protein n=1 Tax=Novosphingobium aquiterrae TaxID=624388 RepID=A0ABV6PF12_9SPHN
MRSSPIVIAVLLLAACKGQSAPEQAATTAAPSQAAPVASASEAASSATSAGSAMAVSEKNDLYEFDYAWPAAAGGIPALKAWLEGDLAAQKAKLIEGAKAWQTETKKGGFPYHAYAHSTKWQVVTDLPGWLSLSAQRWEYTGGAHGNPFFGALLWDKAADKRRAALDLFTSPAALSAAIRGPFCDALDRQREKRRGGTIKRDSGDPFSECLDPVKSVLILGSSDKAHFTRIGVLVGPYEAGPYAEGNYEVTVPVTDAVLKVVRPEYRTAFAAGR